VIGVPALAGGIGGAYYALRPGPTPVPTPVTEGVTVEQAVEAIGRWKSLWRFRRSFVGEPASGLTRYAVVERNAGYILTKEDLVLTKEDLVLIAGRDFLEMAPRVFALPGIEGFELRVIGQEDGAGGKADVQELLLRVSRTTFETPEFSAASWRDLATVLTGPGDAAVPSAYLAPAWRRSQR
jgi:hypothetical protein